MGGHFIQETHKMVNIISEIEAIYFKEDIKVKNQHFRFLKGMNEEKANCQHYFICHLYASQFEFGVSNKFSQFITNSGAERDID